MTDLTVDDIAEAWNSVEDRWTVRENQAWQDGRVYEVIHDWGGDTIDPAKQRLCRRFPNWSDAKVYATKLKQREQAKKVLDLVAGRSQ